MPVFRGCCTLQSYRGFGLSLLLEISVVIPVVLASMSESVPQKCSSFYRGRSGSIIVLLTLLDFRSGSSVAR